MRELGLPSLEKAQSVCFQLNQDYDFISLTGEWTQNVARNKHVLLCKICLNLFVPINFSLGFMFSKVDNIKFSETWSRENGRMGVVGSVTSSCIGEDSLHFCLFQYELPTESKPPSGTSTGCRCLSVCSTLDFYGLQRHILTHHGLHYGLQGSLCTVAWTPHLLLLLLLL